MVNAQRVRELLEAERNRLLEVRRGLDAAELDERDLGSELSSLDQHQADVGSELFEREKELSILHRVGDDLADVVGALLRLDPTSASRRCGTRTPSEPPKRQQSATRRASARPHRGSGQRCGETRRSPRTAPRRRGRLETMGSLDRQWPLMVVFTDHGRTTRADVVLDVAGRHYHGWGTARRSPTDPDVPHIGEEVAASRALSRLAHDLLSAAQEDIGELEHHPAQLRT